LDIFKATQVAWNKRSVETQFVLPGIVEFIAIRAETVDYSTIEHCTGSNFSKKIIPLNAGWNDLGACDAVGASYPKTSTGMHAVATC
jgi:mannose-1-phosphate guanylyltransferase/mannose-6-phosphate isomerase